MIRSITSFLAEHPELPLDDIIQKKQKIDFQIENFVLKLFFSEDKYETINITEKDPLTHRTFFELICIKSQKNLPYVLALALENDGSTLHYLDASSVLQLQKENIINRLDKIFFFTINYQKNNNDCFHILGDSSESADKAFFIETYIKATENDPISQYNLALCYGNGNGINQNLEEAAKWFGYSASLGDPQAQYSLGLCNVQGIGLNQNPVEAVRLFKLSADQGNIEAKGNLGICYYRGFGVGQDFALAVKYFRQAAIEGDSEAQCNLAICYSTGNGLVKDFEKATFWFTLSANQGNAQAIAHLNCQALDSFEENLANHNKRMKYSNDV